LNSPFAANRERMPAPQPHIADYLAIRGATVALSEPLSAEDCCVQSMPDASPIKWHMAHTSWFFETFLLEPHEANFQPFHPAFRILFNSYYNGIGEKHPRSQRGLLSRPSLDEVRAYRENVDARMVDLLAQDLVPDGVRELVELGLQHEQQHQELMVTDLKHMLCMNPLHPAYEHTPAEAPTPASPMTWCEIAAGIAHIGHHGEGFSFDNELPRHRQFVEAYALASRLVTNAEYLAFIEAGGYRDPALWLAAGWDWVRGHQLQQPIYWQCSEHDGWREFTLAGMRALDPHASAIHLSYYEADAYARWAGARLPTEAEWEHAVAVPGIAQLWNVAWQWTSSSYAAYPGFRSAPGALGEYNGKFMSNQYVLRGSSQATPSGHARISYRNFMPATARWQFAGIRLAR
jgi:ergothioneine biosynthesis protein EgtB